MLFYLSTFVLKLTRGTLSMQNRFFSGTEKNISKKQKKKCQRKRTKCKFEIPKGHRTRKEKRKYFFVFIGFCCFVKCSRFLQSNYKKQSFLCFINLHHNGNSSSIGQKKGNDNDQELEEPHTTTPTI